MNICCTNRVLPLVVIFVLLTTVSANTQKHTVTSDAAWKLFKLQYNKTYISDGYTEFYRRSIWEQNLVYINDHNKRAEQGLNSFQLAINKFGDMTRQEVNNWFNTYRSANRTSVNTVTFPRVESIPEELDWRPKGFVTNVKDQGDCGACWAFSATGSLEGQVFGKYEKLVPLSEQNLIDCTRPQGNKGCEGGRMEYAFEYVRKNNGMDTEESYKYIEDDDQECKFTKENVGARVQGHAFLRPYDENNLQVGVALVGPISVAVDASLPSFIYYKSGIYDDPNCSPTKLNHGMLVVGYGFLEIDKKKHDYWLVKNSWGDKWGEDGYIKMSRNKDNQCGIASDTLYPLVK